MQWSERGMELERQVIRNTFKVTEYDSFHSHGVDDFEIVLPVSQGLKHAECGLL